MNHNRMIGAIAVVIIAVVLIGEVIVYTSGTDDFDVDATLSDDAVEYSISVRGSQVYNAVVMDNGTMTPLETLYVYHDEGYASAYESEEGPIGSHEATQEYFIDQLVKHLEFRGMSDVKVLSAKDLQAAMAEDISGGAVSNGLVVVSGALPDTVYSGDAADPLFDWMDAGGRLYWAGNSIGRYVATEDGTREVVNHQVLFFGIDCLNTTDEYFASADVEDNTLRYDLSLKNNRVKYSVDATKLSASGRKCLDAGYTDGTYSSIVFSEYGNGMICVFGGDLSRSLWSDVAQIISSNVCHQTVVIGSCSGSVRYGTATGSIEIDMTRYTGKIVLYAYLGGYYPVYGEFFSF